MNGITTKSGKELSWLGIGTYGIGGRGHRNMPHSEVDEDEVYLNALEHTFNKGMNFTEISLGYGHGHAVRLFAKALKDTSTIKREDLFITNSLYPNDFSSLRDIDRDVEDMYKIFDTDCFDSTLITQSLCLRYGYDEIVSRLHALLNDNRTRYVSLSNAGPLFIQKLKDEFGSRFFAHETHLSYEIRINQDKKVFDLCNEINLENIIWRPLHRKFTEAQNWPLLVELSKTYQLSQSQILLNWMNSLGYMPMVFSTSPAHIDDNFASLDVRLSQQDLDSITDFRVSEVQVPKIDWEKTGEGEMGMADFVLKFQGLYQLSKSK